MVSLDWETNSETYFTLHSSEKQDKTWALKRQEILCPQQKQWGFWQNHKVEHIENYLLNPIHHLMPFASITIVIENPNILILPAGIPMRF